MKLRRRALSCASSLALSLLLAQAAEARQGASANVYYYVSPSSASPAGDDANACTLLAPCLTPSLTLARLANDWDYVGKWSGFLMINCGTWTDQLYLVGAVVGSVELHISGAGSGCTAINAPSGLIAAYTKDYGAYTIGALTLGCNAGAGGEVSSGQFGILDIKDDVHLAACPGGIQIAVDGGSINTIGSTLDIDGGAAALAYLSGGASRLSFNATNLRFNNNPNFTAFTMGISGSGEINLASATITGKATGIKYNIAGGGYITTARGALNVIPGTTGTGVISFGKTDLRIHPAIKKAMKSLHQ